MNFFLFTFALFLIGCSNSSNYTTEYDTLDSPVYEESTTDEEMETDPVAQFISCIERDITGCIHIGFYWMINSEEAYGKFQVINSPEFLQLFSSMELYNTIREVFINLRRLEIEDPFSPKHPYTSTSFIEIFMKIDEEISMAALSNEGAISVDMVLEILNDYS